MFVLHEAHLVEICDFGTACYSDLATQGQFRLPVTIQASKRELGAYTLLWGEPTPIHCQTQVSTWFCCLGSLKFESI